MDAEKERVIKYHLGRTLYSVGAYAPNVNAPHGNLRGLEMKQTWRWMGYRITPELSVLRLSQGQDQWANKRENIRLGVSVRRSF